MTAMIIGVCRVAPGITAIIARITTNKGTELFRLKIPRPSITEEAKPMRYLVLAEVNVDGSCVRNNKLNEKKIIIVKLIIDTTA